MKHPVYCWLHPVFQWRLVIRPIHLMPHILGTTLSQCASPGSTRFYFWTAGQRVEPNRNSAFIWREKSSDANIETLTLMEYTNWASGQPDFFGNYQSCLHIWSGESYKWDDGSCNVALCFVCEIDI